MLTRSHVTLVALLTLAACQTPPAPPPLPPGTLAQPVATDPATEDPAWNWRVAPYVWAAAIKGNVTAHGNKFDFSMPFSDILDDLNYAVFAVVEGHQGQWGVMLDNSYVSLTSDGTVSPLGGPGFKADADAALLISQAAGLYRLAPESPYEVGAGLRYADLRTDIHLGPLPGAHSDESVTDGIVLARGTWPINDRWAFRLYADGGTGDSDFTWQSAATFFYEFQGWSLGLGYRVLDYDMGGSNDADITLKGFTVGADFRF